jgi:hypothetical protein
VGEGGALRGCAARDDGNWRGLERAECVSEDRGSWGWRLEPLQREDTRSWEKHEGKV